MSPRKKTNSSRDCGYHPALILAGHGVSFRIQGGAKWGTSIAIIGAIGGLAAYLYFGTQPVLRMSDADIAQARAPIQKELQDTKDALANANRATEAAKQASFVAIDVKDQPTHVLLQFNAVDATPMEIEAVNTHWATVSYTYKVSKDCPYPRAPTYCQYAAMTLSVCCYDKNDFDQIFIRLILFFDRSIVYQSLVVNAFGANVSQSIVTQTERMATIELTPDKAVTSFVLNIKASPPP